MDNPYEYRIDREQLYSLLSATRKSKNDFEDDLDAYKIAATRVYSYSPIFEKFADHLSDIIDVEKIDYTEEYDSAIRMITNEL